MAPQLLIGFFDDVTEAQQAVQALLSGGFSREALDISAQTREEGPPCADASDTTRPAESGRFFSLLYGGIDNDRQIGTLVTIRVHSDGDVNRATALLNRAGALHISQPTDAARHGPVIDEDAEMDRPPAGTE